MTTDASLLRLLAWLSPAFPTGGFAYSHGIEWAVEAGAVHDKASLREWLQDVLAHGSGRNDAILLRHAHRAAHDAALLGQVIELARASQPTRERLLEATAQGRAFALAARAWDGSVPPDCTHAVAIGVLAARHDVAEDDAALGYTQALMANLISAAVRLVPLGQTDGLAVLASLEAEIVAVVRATTTDTLDDIGGCCLRADLFSALHETQYTRLFRS